MTLVTVETYRTPVFAQLAKGRLDVAGIDSFLMDFELASMDWFLGAAIGSIKLQVHESDVDAAREVLATKADDAEA